MVCPQCRAETPADNQFCGKCGFPLSGEGATYPQSRRDSAVRREITVIFAGITLVLIGVAAAWYLLVVAHSPASAVRSFLEADKREDFAAEQQYVRAGLDSQVILSLLQVYRQTSGKSPFQNYAITTTQVSGETAMVWVQITLPASPNVLAGFTPPRGAAPNVSSVPFQMVREGGNWKIDPAITMTILAGALLVNGFQQWAPTAPAMPMPYAPGPLRMAPPGSGPRSSTPMNTPRPQTDSSPSVTL